MTNNNQGGDFLPPGPDNSELRNEQVKARIRSGQINAETVTSKRKKKRKPTRPDITDGKLSDMLQIGKATGKKRKSNSEDAPFLAYIIGALIVFSPVFFHMERIPAGYAGVAYHYLDSTTEDVLWSGTHMRHPLHNIVQYPVHHQPASSTVTSNTQDGAILNIDLNYTYAISQEYIGDARTLYQFKDSEDIHSDVITPIINEQVSIHVGDYADRSALSEGRVAFTETLESDVAEALKAYNISFDRMTLSIK